MPVPREWVPTRCSQAMGTPWSSGPWCLLMPEEGEKRGEAQAPLSHSCSLFVPLTLVTVVLVPVRGEGLAATRTGALSLSTAQVLCEALGAAGSEPRGCAMDYSP